MARILIGALGGAALSTLAFFGYFLGPWSESREARGAAAQACRRFDALYPAGKSRSVDRKAKDPAARQLELAEARAFAKIAAEKDPAAFVDLMVQLDGLSSFITADLHPLQIEQHDAALDALRKACAKIS